YNGTIPVPQLPTSQGSTGSPTYFAVYATGFGGVNGVTTGVVGNGSVAFSDILATDFNSWRGNAPPVGAAFANEYGNRIFFAVALQDTTGATIDLAKLGFIGKGTLIGPNLTPGSETVFDVSKAPGSFSKSNAITTFVDSSKNPLASDTGNKEAY